MNVLEQVARTFSVETKDGLYVLRPWGARGPCYLMSERQRAFRAWLQLAFYALAISSLWLFPSITTRTSGMFAFVAVFILGGHFMLWLFSFGLPRTDKPPTQTSEQRRTTMVAHSRALGRPTLWVLTVISWLFAVGGIAMVLVLREWLSGLFVFVVFGAFAAIFTWQLRLVYGDRDN